MNWTGGRLHRHSYKKHPSQLKIQKQHFAKARLRRRSWHRAALASRYPPLGLHLQHEMIDRAPGRGKRKARSVSPDERAVAGPEGYGPSAERRTSTPDPSYRSPGNSIRQAKAVTESLDSNVEPILSSSWDDGRHRSNHGDSYHPRASQSDTLENIRRDLLRQPDWASLSIARPPKIKFSSTGRANLAKRRRITEDDERRQGAPQKRVLPQFRERAARRRRHNSSPRVTLDDISIRIGDPVFPDRSSTSQSHLQILSQESSESVLLDKEEAYRRNAMSVNWPSTPNGRNWRCHTVAASDASQMRNRDVTVDGSSPSSPPSTGSSPPLLPEYYQPFTSPGHLSSPRISLSRGLNRTADGFLGSTSVIPDSTHPLAMETPLHHQSTPDKRLQRYAQLYPSTDPPRFEVPNPYWGSREKTSESERAPREPFTSPMVQHEVKLPSHGLAISDSPRYPTYKSSKWLPTTEWSDVGAHSPKPGFCHYHDSDMEAQAGRKPKDIFQVEAREDAESLPAGTKSATQAPSNTPDQLNDTSDASSTARDPVNFSCQIVKTEANVEAEDEVWMSFVFGSDGENEDISVEMPEMRSDDVKARWKNIGVESTIPDGQGDRDASNRTGEAPIAEDTIQTSENTLLNEVPSRGNSVPASETDFLSQFSPMAGYIDESLSRISVHNNPARTVHSINSSGSPQCPQEYSGETHLPGTPGSQVQSRSSPPSPWISSPR